MTIHTPYSTWPIALTAALASGLALSVGLVPPFNSHEQHALAAGILLMDDNAGGNTNADRAALPAVFIGRVIARDGEENVAEPGSIPIMTPAYSVDVETTLKGDAQGQVRLAVFRTDSSAEREGGPVEIGQRYLFAAVDDPVTATYTIDEGFGNVLIPCDKEARDTIAEFERLIHDAVDRSA